MASIVDVTVKNDDKCVQSLQILVDRMEHLEELYESIGAVMKLETQLLFDSGRDVDGSSFIPSIRAQTQGGKTLVDKGNLRSSIDYLASSTGVEWGASSGLTDVYATTHNFGRRITPKKATMLRFKVADKWIFRTSVTIPRRQFVGFNSRLQNRVTETIVKYLEKDL